MRRASTNSRLAPLTASRRARLERAKCVLIVRGDEDHRRKCCLQLAKHTESIEIRHLHIEKHQGGHFIFDRFALLLVD